ncbi:MAG TPA: hypothetical protein VFW40_04240, partial [Capsulimonadaceae bacterium]|nr:hypothetical protein [Capsulimonadaceae bacterium]
MASTQAALAPDARTLSTQDRSRPRIDATFLLGVAIAFGAVVAGVAAAGISIAYFLQPAGALIVVGG